VSWLRDDRDVWDLAKVNVERCGCADSQIVDYDFARAVSKAPARSTTLLK
jgi:hypothetical protein